MAYVALLRGINVGGNSRVEMPRLKTVFENACCGDVLTYINSGNVVFTDNRNEQTLVPILEQAIAKEFNLDIRIMLRDYANISTLCQKIPANWVNDGTQKTDVMFLWDEIDEPEILSKIDFKPERETVILLERALAWNVTREFVTRSSLSRLVANKLYKHMTIRNINSVRKLEGLMAKLEAQEEKTKS